MTTIRKTAYPRSFTLVEVVLCTALGAMLIATGGVIAVQAATAQRAMRQSLLEQGSRFDVVDTFESDLRFMVNNPPSSEAFSPLAMQGNRLEVMALVPVGSCASGTVRRLPAKVEYRVVDDPQSASMKRLIRKVTDLTDKEVKPFEETVAEGLAEAELSVFADNRWVQSLEPKLLEKAVPRAFRLLLRWSHGKPPALTRTVLLDSTRGSQPFKDRL